MECGWYFHSSRFPLKVWIIGNLFIKSIAVTGGPSSLHWRTRSWLLLFSARMVLFPASGVVLQRLFTKACMGCKRFFLKARKNQLKNVMFLNKIDLPYCLVVFFVVCSRLRPFWSVFGELPRRYFGVPLLREIQGRTVINFLSVRRSRRIIPLEHYPRPQFLQNFKAEKLQFHVHSLDSQFLNGSLEESSSKCGSRSSKR